MASVNANARVQLNPTTLPSDATGTGRDGAGTRSADDVGTPGDGFLGGLTSIGSSLASVGTDLWDVAGGKVDSGTPQLGWDLGDTASLTAVTAGPTALVALAGRANPAGGPPIPYLENLGTTAATGAIRVTPTLVSAILGPAAADGVTMIAPNLVKKYRDTKNLKTEDDKKAAEKNNQYAKISRGIAGGIAVGLAAGAVFLLKPEWFKKFGVGVTHAIEGSTKVSIGKETLKLAGVLDEAAIRATKGVADGTAVKILKQVAPMAKDAVFTNRVLTSAVGGVGTLLLANAAAGEQDPEKRKLMIGLTAAAGVATVGGAWGIGKLTQRSIASQAAATAAGAPLKGLAANGKLPKPNVEWIKKYAGLIAPITAVPAYTAASQYYNVYNDFNEITGPRSPFRK